MGPLHQNGGIIGHPRGLAGGVGAQGRHHRPHLPAIAREPAHRIAIDRQPQPRPGPHVDEHHRRVQRLPGPHPILPDHRRQRVLDHRHGHPQLLAQDLAQGHPGPPGQPHRAVGRPGRRIHRPRQRQAGADQPALIHRAVPNEPAHHRGDLHHRRTRIIDVHIGRRGRRPHLTTQIQRHNGDQGGIDVHPHGDARGGDDIQDRARTPPAIDPGPHLGQQTPPLKTAHDRRHRLHRQPRRSGHIPLTGSTQTAEGVNDDVLVVPAQTRQTGARPHRTALLRIPHRTGRAPTP